MLSDKSIQRGSIDVEKKKTRVVSNKKCSSSINQSVGRARAGVTSAFPATRVRQNDSHDSFLIKPLMIYNILSEIYEILLFIGD
jgi:hypothetical protein